MINDLLDEGYQVNLTMKGPVPAKDGLLNENTLEENKDKLFKFVTDYLKKEFLEVKKGFPKKGIAEVDLSIDMVVMKGEDFRRLRKLLENE
jgi:hypothetical protein